MINFRGVYAVGILVLWLTCFVANQMANDPKSVEDRAAYFNISTLKFKHRSPIVNNTYSEFEQGFANNTFIYNFDRRCFDFFVVASSFFSASFALMNVTAINLVKPRISWILCMLICYGINIAGHLSFHKEIMDQWITVAASAIGFFWAFFVVSISKSRFCNCTDY